VVINPQKNPITDIKWEKKPEKGEKMSDIRREIENVIGELEKIGVTPNSHMINNVPNLKEVIDNTLTSSGITQERFLEWFSLKECNCTKRKAWLNSIFRWKKNLPQG